MDILVFLLLAAVWAAFLLPRFMDSRRDAPITTTRNFARSTALLASVASMSAHNEAMARRRNNARRRQILTALVVTAMATLVTAIWQGSVSWLVAALVADAMVAGYIAILLQIKQQRTRSVGVVERLPESFQTSEEIASVRIVAG